MDSTETVCPVCTLFLRPGITLKSHLSSHPKQKVIEALVNLTSSSKNEVKDVAIINQSPEISSVPAIDNQGWSQPVNNFTPMPANHSSFIYQQFMSTTSQPPNVPVNPLGQQYVSIPTVFNPQLICQPYMYQQQQFIMSAGSAMHPLSSAGRKPQIIDLSNDIEQLQPMIANTESEKDEIKENDEADDTIVIDDDGASNRVGEDLHSLTSELILDKEEVDDCNDLTENKDDEDLEDSYENVVSPTSSVGSDFLRVRTDLNKACQTPHLGQVDVDDIDSEVEEIITPDFFNLADHAIITPIVEPPEVQKEFLTDENRINNVVQSNDQVIDMDGMQLVLCSDFMGSQLISQVEDFECISNRSERPILMNIGGMDGGVNEFEQSNRNIDQLGDESISRESTNMSIRADEHMPPRGELSGQESNGGASDAAWSRSHYESNSGTSTSYDLLARETWEGSDCSDLEVPPLQSRIPPQTEYNPDLDDTPTIVSVTEAPLNFKCPVCGEGFKCPKERRVHQSEVHSGKNEDESSPLKVTNNTIGSRLNKKPVKKLQIKPKVTGEIKKENNFDNVFTNKLNTEPTEIESGVLDIIAIKSPTIEGAVSKKEEVKCWPCHLCSSVFATSKVLKKHKTVIHGTVSRFKCDTCGEDMQTETNFNEHLKIHPLECHICGKYFHRRQNIQLHMKRHLGIKPYTCQFCQKSFLTKQKLDEHKNTHTGEAPIKCNMCDESFRRHSNLVQHRNRHHLNIKKKVKDYICYCGEILHSKKKLAWHKEIHDLKPKACTHCSEKFVHAASLTRHMRRAHNGRFVPSAERNNENVECPICKGVYLRSSLEVHIRNHSGTRPFTCSICNKDFTTKWNLKLHRWTHAARASKPFKCDQCKGAFIREADYIAHMNSHKSVRPYTCNYCGAQFIRKYNCQRHVKEHEKDKTYTCPACNKSFHRSYYLKDHMRVHSGIRPYSCHICGKTSTTKSNHNKHVMIHHAKEPISTEN